MLTPSQLPTHRGGYRVLPDRDFHKRGAGEVKGDQGGTVFRYGCSPANTAPPHLHAAHGKAASIPSVSYR